MPEAAAAATATSTETTAAAATATAAAPWYQGKVDGELLGHMQTLGLHTKTAEEAAIAALTAHREARGFIGMPETRLLKLPADPAKDSDGMRAVFQRLGAPKEAKDYDFTGIKFADGKTLAEGDAVLETTIRNALFDAMVPKEYAPRIAQAITKYSDDISKSELADRSASITEAKANLAKNWGTKFEANKFIASQAAQKMGMSPEEVTALENAVGYDRVMETFLKIGIKTGEASYVIGDNPANGGVMSREQAKNRLVELENDKDWTARFNRGDTAAKREWDAITKMASDEAA